MIKEFPEDVLLSNIIKAQFVQDIYKSFQLCGTIVKTLDDLHNNQTLNLFHQEKDFSILLPSSTSSHTQKLSLEILMCKYKAFNQPIFLYYLIRDPKIRSRLFVVYDRNNETKIQLFKFYKNVFSSYNW